MKRTAKFLTALLLMVTLAIAIVPLLEKQTVYADDMFKPTIDSESKRITMHVIPPYEGAIAKGIGTYETTVYPKIENPKIKYTETWTNDNYDTLTSSFELGEWYIYSLKIEVTGLNSENPFDLSEYDIVLGDCYYGFGVDVEEETTSKQYRSAATTQTLDYTFRFTPNPAPVSLGDKRITIGGDHYEVYDGDDKPAVWTLIAFQENLTYGVPGECAYSDRLSETKMDIDKDGSWDCAITPLYRDDSDEAYSLDILDTSSISDEYTVPLTPATQYFVGRETFFYYENMIFDYFHRANPMRARGKTAIVKRSKVKKKKQVILREKIISLKNAKGKVTYDIPQGQEYASINSKTGNLTVRKGTPKGWFSFWVNVKVAGKGEYAPDNKLVRVTVDVK